MTPLRTRLALAALLFAPSLAVAQTSAVVDEGTFTVTQKGQPLGRESFRIIRAPAPGGQAFQATGTSVLGELKVTSRLGTDSSGTPVSYESDITRRAELVQRIKGRGPRGRFSMLIQTRTGESAREYVLNNGALLLDEDVFIHFFFVGLAAQRGELVVISPRSSQQVRVRLETQGEETVEIAGRSIPGRHFVLSGADGNRDVWLDAQGRLLKVAMPATGLIALRDDPPR